MPKKPRPGSARTQIPRLLLKVATATLLLSLRGSPRLPSSIANLKKIHWVLDVRDRWTEDIVLEVWPPSCAAENLPAQINPMFNAIVIVTLWAEAEVPRAHMAPGQRHSRRQSPTMTTRLDRFSRPPEYVISTTSFVFGSPFREITHTIPTRTHLFCKFRLLPFGIPGARNSPLSSTQYRKAEDNPLPAS